MKRRFDPFHAAGGNAPHVSEQSVLAENTGLLTRVENSALRRCAIITSMAINTSFAIIKKPGISQGLLHVYEHLLINRFYLELAKTEWSPHFFGRVNADAYDDMIMAYGGFYCKEVQKIWDKVTRGVGSKFSPKELEDVIKIIESEEGAELEIVSRELLLKAINRDFKVVLLPDIVLKKGTEFEKIMSCKENNILRTRNCF